MKAPVDFCPATVPRTPGIGDGDLRHRGEREGDEAREHQPCGRMNRMHELLRRMNALGVADAAHVLRILLERTADALVRQRGSPRAQHNLVVRARSIVGRFGVIIAPC
jgi:hypothetical protein